MIIEKGEKIHIIARKLWENDHRRHFLGQVKRVEGSIARVEGYVFIFNPFKDEYIRRPELRVRVVDLAADRFVVNIIHPATVLENVRYEYSKERRLEVTDGEAFTLDINEYSPGR